MTLIYFASAKFSQGAQKHEGFLSTKSMLEGKDWNKTSNEISAPVPVLCHYGSSQTFLFAADLKQESEIFLLLK